MLLKPGPFLIRAAGDPEQTLQDFVKYVARFKKFLLATGVEGEHTAEHADCGACRKAKATLELVGGDEMTRLFEHVGLVVDGDTLDQAISKVELGVKKQTNQATARFKLFQQMPQRGDKFGQWFTRVREQADRCNWENYGAREAARDAILFQTDSKRLQRKIVAEDLSYDDSVKFGLALEQGESKVEQMRSHNGNGSGSRESVERVAALEEQVRRMQSGGKRSAQWGRASSEGGEGSGRQGSTGRRGSSSQGSGGGEVQGSGGGEVPCTTCPAHWHTGRCPGLSSQCFSCGEWGHFKFSAACKRSKKREVIESRAVESQSETDDTDSEVENVDRVERKKEKFASLSATLVDHGRQGKSKNVKFLVDSGADKTMMSEKDWKTMGTKLKRCTTEFRVYGSRSKMVPILGRSKCILQAAGGAVVRTMVYVVRGESKSLLGLQDGKALGILSIWPEGRVCRVEQRHSRAEEEKEGWTLVQRRKGRK